ncbi:MAG: hypothetical protein ACR2RE_29090 [Geminicoccaceae bacterium]
MDKRKLVYQLMHRAFIDIRLAAHEGKDSKGFFRIVDLFHNVPLALERLDREGGSVDELLEEIVARSKRNGSLGWLEHAAKEIDPTIKI